MRGKFEPLVEHDTGSPWFNYAATLVNSQRVCLWLPGIFKVVVVFFVSWTLKSQLCWGEVVEGGQQVCFY